MPNPTKNAKSNKTKQNVRLSFSVENFSAYSHAIRALLLFFFVEDERNAVVVDGFDADIHLVAHAESANAVT